MIRRETDVITRDMKSRTLVLLSMKILLPKELEPACAVDIVLTTVEQHSWYPPDTRTFVPTVELIDLQVLFEVWGLLRAGDIVY